MFLMKNMLKIAFDERPIVEVAGKKYCINSLTDHSPITSPELLDEIVAQAEKVLDFSKADFLVGEEDRGGYICAIFSHHFKTPFTLTKWNPSGLEGEVAVDFKNAYTNGKLYLNGITELKGKKAIIVEDIIDTGGTIISMVNLLRNAGIEVVDIFAVAEKDDYKGYKEILNQTGIEPKVLVRFVSEDSKSKVTWLFNE